MDQVAHELAGGPRLQRRTWRAIATAVTQRANCRTAHSARVVSNASVLVASCWVLLLLLALPRAVNVWLYLTRASTASGPPTLGRHESGVDGAQGGVRGGENAKWVWFAFRVSSSTPCHSRSHSSPAAPSHTPSATAVQSANPVTRAVLLTPVGQAKISRARIKYVRYLCPTCGTWGYLLKRQVSTRTHSLLAVASRSSPLWIGSASGCFCCWHPVEPLFALCPGLCVKYF